MAGSEYSPAGCTMLALDLKLQDALNLLPPRRDLLLLLSRERLQINQSINQS